jgi:endonuclease/exonuclease/phosphatase (EEP) superfamily protein YafD
MLRRLIDAAVVVGAFMTLAGALAPLLPQADIANQFRPYTLAGSAGLLALALLARMPRMARWGAILTAVNAALLPVPLLWSAEAAVSHAPEQTSAVALRRDIKIVTFNVLWRNEQTEAIARFLLQEDADIVLLQEMTDQHLAVLRPLLAARYPHMHVCLGRRLCRSAMLAKRPWVAVEHVHRGPETPEVILAQFDDAELGSFHLFGVHTAVPSRSRQASQLEWLIARRLETKGPVILAGDFNMTPWAYRMQRLLASAGLRRHATFLRSWPTGGQLGFPAPAILIDHVLTSPEIRTVSIETGPYLGSDHLPVVARLRLPAP